MKSKRMNSTAFNIEPDDSSEDESENSYTSVKVKIIKNQKQ